MVECRRVDVNSSGLGAATDTMSTTDGGGRYVRDTLDLLHRLALGADHFVERWCVECGYEGTTWVHPDGGLVMRCPRCLRERVRALRRERGSLPDPVAYLETMAERDLARQSLENRWDLTVEFDVFVRCDRCDALLERDDARYWLPEGATSSPPYCRPCYAELREGTGS
jgi:uncharacterized C2H2 Zn-finger protein